MVNYLKRKRKMSKQYLLKRVPPTFTVCHVGIAGVGKSGRTRLAVALSNSLEYDAIIVLTSYQNEDLWNEAVQPFVYHASEAIIRLVHNRILKAHLQQKILLVIDDVQPSLFVHLAPTMNLVAASITVCQPNEDSNRPHWVQQWWISKTWNAELYSLKGYGASLPDKELARAFKRLPQFSFANTEFNCYMKSAADIQLLPPKTVLNYIKSISRGPSC